ncbi:MAG: GNAT family N-acetyltransferase [Cyclobacteriaceae bacterium]|nr:GNAT family N-acetyltransferase [Cyclobacteriaceae bacterium]
MSIYLRNAALNDVPILQEMVCQTITEICAKDYSKRQIEVWVYAVKNSEKWQNRVKDQQMRIAQIDGRIVGVASLKDNCYIDLMYVAKDFQNLGIANRLLQDITLIAIENNTKKLESDVSITAKGYFESKGFKVVRENRNMLNGTELINFRMEKDILLSEVN